MKNLQIISAFFVIILLKISQVNCSLLDTDKIFFDLAHTEGNLKSPFATFTSIGFSDNIIGHAVISSTYNPGTLRVYFSKEQDVALYSTYTKSNDSHTYSQIQACKVDGNKMMVLFKIEDEQDGENINLHTIQALIFDSSDGSLIAEKTIIKKDQTISKDSANYASCIQLQTGEVLITFQHKNTQYDENEAAQEPGYIKFDIANDSLSEMKTIGNLSSEHITQYGIPVSITYDESSFIMVYYLYYSIKVQIINNDLTLRGEEQLLFEYPSINLNYQVQLQSMENGKEFIMMLHNRLGINKVKIFKFNYQFDKLKQYDIESVTQFTQIQYSNFSRNLFIFYIVSTKLYGSVISGYDFTEIILDVQISHSTYIFGSNSLTICQNKAKDQQYLQVYYPQQTFEGATSTIQMNSAKFRLTQFIPIPCSVSYCQDCNDYVGKCIECNEGSNRKINGDGSQCICTDGFEENGGVEVCKIICNSQCASCDNAITCLTCSEGSAIGEYCYTDTPGQYPVIDKLNGNVSYQDCMERCGTCDNGSTCLTCKEDEQEGQYCIVKKTGMLVVVGEDGSVSYSKCNEKCSECQNSVDECSACKSDSNRDINTNCACKKTYKESDLGQCEKITCTDFCKNCNEETGVCIECNDDFNRKTNEDGSECICSDGFEENGGAEVCKIICNSRCASCDNAITCLTCLDGKAIGEYCYTETPGKYPIFDEVNGNVYYNDCYTDRCATCENKSTCLTCKEKDQIGPLCYDYEKGYLAVVDENGSVIYQSCEYYCGECIDTAENCIACKFGSHRDLKKNCGCELGYEETQNKECQKIEKKPLCDSNQYEYQGQCQYCYYLDSDLYKQNCLQGVCPIEYRIDYSQNLCIKNLSQEEKEQKEKEEQKLKEQKEKQEQILKEQKEKEDKKLKQKEEEKLKEKNKEEKSNIVPVILIIVGLAVVLPVTGFFIYKKIVVQKIQTNSKSVRKNPKIDIECHSSNQHSDHTLN